VFSLWFEDATKEEGYVLIENFSNEPIRETIDELFEVFFLIYIVLFSLFLFIYLLVIIIIKNKILNNKILLLCREVFYIDLIKIKK
jgi:hypothetical protein